MAEKTETKRQPATLEQHIRIRNALANIGWKPASSCTTGQRAKPYDEANGDFSDQGFATEEEYLAHRKKLASNKGNRKY
jgi:hypothetical protein